MVGSFDNHHLSLPEQMPRPGVLFHNVLHRQRDLRGVRRKDDHLYRDFRALLADDAEYSDDQRFLWAALQLFRCANATL
jgi:hypothetical protein